jgi:hypothetical protein
MIFIGVMLLVIVSVLIMIMVAVITSPNALYMFMFEHEEWKMWRYVKRNIDNFKYCPNNYVTLGSMYFVYGEYYVAVSVFAGDECASVHRSCNHDCVCGYFWRHRSKKVAKMLKEKLSLSELDQWEKIKIDRYA